MTRWNLDTIPWNSFDGSRVHPQLLAFARGACLVEFNADAYTDYLCRVFGSDPELQVQFRAWGAEEVRHGLALKKWVELADPHFDFERSVAIFRAAYQQVPKDGGESVRGSRARELVARCIVETGTTSYYSALKDAAQEPVFKEICRLIAQDEVSHFNLFRKALNNNYGPKEGLGFPSRFKVVVGRILETSDEELSFAYRAGNFPDEPIEQCRAKEYSKDFMRRVSGLYKPEHYGLIVGLTMKVLGIYTGQRFRTVLSHIAHRFLRFRYQVTGSLAQL
jgi:rubrerythrin